VWELVAGAAGAVTTPAAVELNAIALALEALPFGGAERSIQRWGLCICEVAVLDVCHPSANRRPRRQGRGERGADSGRDRRGRNYFNRAGCQHDAGQRGAGQIHVYRESSQTIRREQAAAALRDFLIRIEDVDGGADVAASPGIGKAYRGIRGTRGIRVREVIYLESIGARSGGGRGIGSAQGQS
jgi:hypothetical protein